MVKPTSICVVLSIAISRGWYLRQLDVNNAFLQGNLFETVYMSQPQGFIDKDHSTHVCKLRKAIYGLERAPRAWYQRLCHFILLLASGFTISHVNSSLFVYNVVGHIIYLLVDVDDIILTSNTTAIVNQFVTTLAHHFSLKDLGLLTYFLGVKVVSNKNGVTFSTAIY